MRRRLLSPAPPPHLRLSQRQHSQCCPAPTLPSHHWWSRGYSFAMRTTASTDSTALGHRLPPSLCSPPSSVLARAAGAASRSLSPSRSPLSSVLVRASLPRQRRHQPVLPPLCHHRRSSSPSAPPVAVACTAANHRQHSHRHYCLCTAATAIEIVCTLVSSATTATTCTDDAIALAIATTPIITAVSWQPKLTKPTCKPLSEQAASMASPRRLSHLANAANSQYSRHRATARRSSTPPAPPFAVAYTAVNRLLLSCSLIPPLPPAPAPALARSPF